MTRPVDGATVMALLALVASRPQPAGGAISYSSFKQQIRDAAAKDPIDAVFTTLFGGAFLFYLAERETNPKVTSYWDALVYTSTCFSVGYADIFARTPAGKAIATALMTFGPALTASLLNPPADTAPEPSPQLLQVQHAIADKLDAILVELRAARAG